MSEITLRIESQYWDGVVEFNMNRDLYEKELANNPRFLASLLANHINSELARDARSLFTVTKEEILSDISLPVDQRKFKIAISQELPREEKVPKPAEVVETPPRQTHKTFVPEPGVRGEWGYVVEVDEDDTPEGRKLS